MYLGHTDLLPNQGDIDMLLVHCNRHSDKADCIQLHSWKDYMHLKELKTQSYDTTHIHHRTGRLETFQFIHQRALN